jgi:hypothetical protein
MLDGKFNFSLLDTGLCVWLILCSVGTAGILVNDLFKQKLFAKGESEVVITPFMDRSGKLSKFYTLQGEFFPWKLDKVKTASTTKYRIVHNGLIRNRGKQNQAIQARGRRRSAADGKCHINNCKPSHTASTAGQEQQEKPQHLSWPLTSGQP